MAFVFALVFLKPSFRALFAFNGLDGCGKCTRRTGKTFDGTGVGGVLSIVARDSSKRPTFAIETFGTVLGAIGGVDERPRWCIDATSVASAFVAGTFFTMFARGLT